MFAVVITSKQEFDCLANQRFVSYTVFTIFMLLLSIVAYVDGYFSFMLVGLDVLCLGIILQSMRPIKETVQNVLKQFNNWYKEMMNK